MNGHTPVVIKQDRHGRYFAMTKRPLALNFPVRINNQTYFDDIEWLKQALIILGYDIKESE